MLLHGLACFLFIFPTFAIKCTDNVLAVIVWGVNHDIGCLASAALINSKNGTNILLAYHLAATTFLLDAPLPSLPLCCCHINLYSLHKFGL